MASFSKKNLCFNFRILFTGIKFKVYGFLKRSQWRWCWPSRNRTTPSPGSSSATPVWSSCFSWRFRRRCCSRCHRRRRRSRRRRRQQFQSRKTLKNWGQEETWGRLYFFFFFKFQNFFSSFYFFESCWCRQDSDQVTRKVTLWTWMNELGLTNSKHRLGWATKVIGFSIKVIKDRLEARLCAFFPYLALISAFADGAAGIFFHYKFSVRNTYHWKYLTSNSTSMYL